MSKQLYNKLKFMLRGYHDANIPINTRIIEVEKPVNNFPRCINGILFLPNNNRVIIYTFEDDVSEFEDWKHEDQVVDCYGFSRELGSDPFGIKRRARGERKKRIVTNTIVKKLGPDFLEDLHSTDMHRVVAARWDITPDAVSFQRRKLGIKLQELRREKGLTAYLN